MWPGKLRTIRFEFSGPSMQAALDKLPTARIIERLGGSNILLKLKFMAMDQNAAIEPGRMGKGCFSIRICRRNEKRG